MVFILNPWFRVLNHLFFFMFSKPSDTLQKECAWWSTRINTCSYLPQQVKWFDIFIIVWKTKTPSKNISDILSFSISAILNNILYFVNFWGSTVSMFRMAYLIGHTMHTIWPSHLNLRSTPSFSSFLTKGLKSNNCFPIPSKQVTPQSFSWDLICFLSISYRIC